MLGNLEVPLRQKLGITVVHISNGGFAGYGPGFWGRDMTPLPTLCWGTTRLTCQKCSANWDSTRNASANRPK